MRIEKKRWLILCAASLAGIADACLTELGELSSGLEKSYGKGEA